MKLVQFLKRKYACFAENSWMASAFFAAYFLFQKIQNKECRRCTYKAVTREAKQEAKKKHLQELCAAVICDDITWQNLKQECQAYFLTPRNWKTIFYENKPDVFFCESAWSGIKEYGNCWHGKIYKNKRLLFENRKELLEILKFCKEQKIPTVFWNKEDPAFFESDRYDFKSTALEFDYIFTTAAECVDKYRAQGHNHVDILPFGFSPYLFNPMNCYPKERTAVFAGSWYAEEQERCRNLVSMFDMVVEKGIGLVIYDRQTGNAKEGRTYPEKYQRYVHPALPFEELGRTLKKSKYAINVNTITNSETMFARRVMELMAMNTVVISNDSVGMRKLFQDSIWFAGEEICEEDLEEKCLRNLEYVFSARTNQKLFTEAFDKVGILEKQAAQSIEIFVDGQGVKNDGEYDYGFFWDGKSQIPEFEKMLPHFCYLPQECGIRASVEETFAIQENTENQNVLFPKEMCCLLLNNPYACTKKYLLGVSTK